MMLVRVSRLIAVKRRVHVKPDGSSQQWRGRDDSRASDRAGYREQDIDDLLNAGASRQRRFDDRPVGRAGPTAGDQRGEPKQGTRPLVASFAADNRVAFDQ